VAAEELTIIEAESNRRLVANSQVKTTVTSKDDAEEMGAIAFFGDKYGEMVRVVQVGEFSTEFCGGTHTGSSAEVGPLLLTSESSIGSNIRRLEALTGMAAYDHLVSVRDSLSKTGRMLKTGPSEVPSRVEALLERVSGMEKELDILRSQKHDSVAEELAAGAQKVGDWELVVADAGDVNGNELRQIALGVRDRLQHGGLVVIGSSAGGKGALVAVMAKELVAHGLSAGELLAKAARELGGGGSRDPELAQAGGPNGAQLGAALEVARTEAEEALSSL
jgi:alanyl-tRNA synthetase